MNKAEIGEKSSDLFRKDIEGIWNDVIWRGEANPNGVEVDSTRLQLMYEMSRRFFNRVLAESDDWIIWGGGDICPLAPTQRVEVMLRNGETYSGKVKWFQWRHVGNGLDIVKYRVIKKVSKKMTQKELKLIIMLLEEEQNHTRFVYSTWSKNPPNPKLEPLEQQYELGYKAGYADGLLHATCLLRGNLSDEVS